jgi:SpoVK/Ycf46/Vps4 family AAA+-type ATPase
MGDLTDLELVLRSGTPILTVETHEERRALDMFRRLAIKLNRPLFAWSITEGLQRMDLELDAQAHNSDPASVLRHIKSSGLDAIYLMLDFHPYIDEPVHVRLIREIAHDYRTTGKTLVFVSHDLDIPAELHKQSARFDLALPNRDKLMSIIREEALQWSNRNQKKKVHTDSQTLDRLVRNLAGLTVADARRLARKVIFDDGAITETDLPEVMKAKYELLNKDGLLSYEYETEKFSDVGGMTNVRRWLEQRSHAFASGDVPAGLDAPKGILLLGVQGCGKSMVAKATAAIFSVPLLRLDFGVLYNKYFGESEKNLRRALATTEVMAPCVLWIDEIEKGLSTGDNDGGTSRRVMGTLLTWMAEKSSSVFLVATANDIESLPPELIRKGRFDEIFFVDLPGYEARRKIFEVHLSRRGRSSQDFDIDALARASDGFSGAEIEQAVVSALYAVHGNGGSMNSDHILEEISRTQPLSVVMAEKIATLRQWATGRTVPAD